MTLADACSACLSLLLRLACMVAILVAIVKGNFLILFLLIKETEVNIPVDHTNLFHFDQICFIELGVKPRNSTGQQHPVN